MKRKRRGKENTILITAILIYQFIFANLEEKKSEIGIFSWNAGFTLSQRITNDSTIYEKRKHNTQISNKLLYHFQIINNNKK